MGPELFLLWALSLHLLDNFKWVLKEIIVIHNTLFLVLGTIKLKRWLIELEALRQELPLVT